MPDRLLHRIPQAIRLLLSLTRCITFKPMMRLIRTEGAIAPAGPAVPNTLGAALRDRLGTLRNLPRLLGLVWRTSPGLALATVALRLLRALLPTAALYVGKLIIDTVVADARLPHPGPALGDWIAAGRLTPVALLVLAEAGLGVLSDLLGRAASLVGDLLAQRYSDSASLQLMRHAATLDLEQFESADQQDRLDRARRQVTGRSSVLQLVFGQAQDLVTVAALAIGFAAYAPWLLVLLAVALVPAAYGELHFQPRGLPPELHPHAGAAAGGLPPLSRRQRRDREGGEALRPGGFPGRPIRGAVGADVRRYPPAGDPPRALGRALRHAECRLILRRICRHPVADARRSGDDRRSRLSRRLAPAPARPAGRPAARPVAARLAGDLSRGPVLLLRHRPVRAVAGRSGALPVADPPRDPVRERRVSLPRGRSLGGARPRLRDRRSGGRGAGGRERRRQDHDRQAAVASLRPDRRADHGRRHRPSPIRPRRAAQPRRP